MAVFTWYPEWGLAKATTTRTKTVRFGDGYSQRTADGINTLNQTRSLAFNNRTSAEIAAIEAFLEARNGVEAFDWTDQAGVAGKYICTQWSRSDPGYDLSSLTAEFTRVYEA